MSAITTQSFDLPTRARPSFVSLLPGGRQDFPVDAIADAYVTRNSRDALAKAGVVLHVRRRPQAEVVS